MEGISRNFWCNPHLEPPPFKFEYSHRWRTPNLSRQPVWVFDDCMVKTFFLISSWNFSCSSVSVAFCPVPSCWTHSRELMSVLYWGAQNHMSDMVSEVLQRGTGWLPSTCCCPLLQGHFANSCSICSSGSSGACCFLCPGPVQVHDTTTFAYRTLSYPLLNFIRFLWALVCAWTTLPQLGIIRKLAECALLPTDQVVHKDVKCSDMNVQ